jgi:ABC-type iron transport system FetAB permease component
MKNRYIVLSFLLVLAPIFILSLHYYNRTKEPFAASQGGALQQLMAGHVASEEEIKEIMAYQKRQVVQDITKLTEPESGPGPYPANRR